MKREGKTSGRGAPDGPGQSASKAGLDAGTARLLAALFEQSPVGMAIIDAELRYRAINETLAVLNRVPAAEHIGRSINDVLGHYPTIAQIVGLVRRALAGEAVSAVISEPQDLSPRRHFAASYYPLRSDEGRSVAVVAWVQLITTEHEMAQALAASEARYRTLVELSGQMVWSAMADGTVDYVNRHFVEYTGLSLEQAQGRAWKTILHPDDAEATLTRRRAAFAAGTPYVSEHRLRRHDGEYRWFLAQAQPVRDAQGRILRWIGVSTDIHEHRQLEQALGRYQLLSRHSRDIILFVRGDDSGEILEANDAACAAYGRPHSELVGMKMVELRAPRTRPDYAGRLAEVRAASGGVFETEHLRADGSTFPVEVSAGMTTVGGEPVFLSVVRDISARRRVEREREENERFRELFVGVLGHDLRTPLQGILTSADLMLSRGGLDGRQQETLKRIISSSERMSGMISQVLDLTRARLGGGIPLERRAARLRAVIDRVVEDQRLIDAKVRIEVSADGDDRGHWDTDRLGQLFQNLVENALRHGDRDRPVRVSIDGSAADRVVVGVHNFGPPIDGEEVPHVFDPFRQGARRARSRGLGLGLYIAREIVAAHAGEIEVRSSAAEGTTFVVTLPRRKATARD